MHGFKRTLFSLVLVFGLEMIIWRSAAGIEIQQASYGNLEDTRCDSDTNCNSSEKNSIPDLDKKILGQTATIPAEMSTGNFSAFHLPDRGEVNRFGDGVYVVRVYFSELDQIDQIIIGREPWQVNREGGYLVIEATAAEIERLESENFVVEIDQKLSSIYSQPNIRLPGQTSGIPGYPCYRTVEETYNSALALSIEHPELATWIDVGNSWEKIEPGGNEGYDLMALKLTNSVTPGPKPALFVVSGIHAREYAPVELNMRFAEYLIENYGIDADVTWLLDYHQIHLMFHANPDGRKKAETGLSWRKNTNDSYCATPSQIGVDLNRNFSFSWRLCGDEVCSSSNPCYSTYRGPSGGSEYETQAIENYLHLLFPDQREDDLSAAAPITSTGVFIDIHSYGEWVLWPWGFTENLPPNAAETQTLGRKFAFFNDYYPVQAVGLSYPSDGATDDFVYGTLGVAAFTFEIGTDFFQDCETFEDTIYPENLKALIYAAQIARNPYITPGGPDVKNLSFPLLAVQGEPAQLRATIDDTRFNTTNGNEPTQNISAAEFYLDYPPWITTTLPISISMQVIDGDWDEKIEDVQAMLDTTGLEAGKHILYFRGRDASNIWGPVSAAFIDIVDPISSGVISGMVRDIDTGHPLEAVITAGGFFTTSNAITGLYSLRVLSGTYDLQVVSGGYAAVSITGIDVQSGNNVEQDLYLQQICGQELLNDDVESGNRGWQADFPWEITTEKAFSPFYAWTDSPGGNYANNLNVCLTSPVFDLTNYYQVAANFWHIYDIEPYPGQTFERYDYGAIEISTDGESWTEVNYYDGYDHTTWEYQHISFTGLDGQSFAQFRFHFHSDESVNADGWYIDDIVLEGTGPICPPMPVAAFDSPDSIYLGQMVTLTNLSTNSVNFYWDFGDGEQGYFSGNPTHFYDRPGYYTVTLTATNSTGNDSISRVLGVHLFWDSLTNGIHWTGDVSVTGQTSETLALVDVITATGAVTWTSTWNPNRLTLDFVKPHPMGKSQVDGSGGILTWTIPGSGLPVTHFLTRTMIIRPCSWQTTTVTQAVLTGDGMSEQRLMTVNKLLPVLKLTSPYQPNVEPGVSVTFTLAYSNTGGLENDIQLLSVFPPGAIFSTAFPAPDIIDPSGSTVTWNLGALAKDQRGEVSISVIITESLQPGDRVAVNSVLLDHTGAEAATSITQFNAPVIDWTIYLPLIAKE